MTTNEKIIKLRRCANVNQKTFANALNVSKSTISRIERGIVEARVELVKLAESVFFGHNRKNSFRLPKIWGM